MVAKSRNPMVYQYDRNRWTASIKQGSGRTLQISIPKAIVEDLRLRPGMRCLFKIEIDEGTEE